jgi:hypothetical protein
MEWLAQLIRSHPFLAVLGTAFGTVFAVIIAPIAVQLFLLYVGNPWAEPDLTVDANFGVGFEAEDAISQPVIVNNAGDATAEYCYVKVTDTHTQKDFGGPNLFSIPPGQKHVEHVVIPIPKLPKGQTWDQRKYRIRAECAHNAVSPDHLTTMQVYGS